MTNELRRAILVALVFVGWQLAAADVQSDEKSGKESSPKKIEVGGKVPGFTMVDLTGGKIRLSELRKSAGKSRPLVMTFWCSFCHSCRHVERDLDALAKEYNDKAVVVGIDASGETVEQVADFLREKGLAVPIMIDPEGLTADLFGTRVTTTTVVIDREGVLRYCGQFGHGEHAFAEDALKAVLAGKEVAVKATPHRG
jgi:thiol-disulfide isomerase/thioredoxin